MIIVLLLKYVILIKIN